MVVKKVQSIDNVLNDKAKRNYKKKPPPTPINSDSEYSDDSSSDEEVITFTKLRKPVKQVKQATRRTVKAEPKPKLTRSNKQLNDMSYNDILDQLKTLNNKFEDFNKKPEPEVKKTEPLKELPKHDTDQEKRDFLRKKIMNFRVKKEVMITRKKYPKEQNKNTYVIVEVN